jgi:hypothetical protein
VLKWPKYHGKKEPGAGGDLGSQSVGEEEWNMPSHYGSIKFCSQSQYNAPLSL